MNGPATLAEMIKPDLAVYLLQRTDLPSLNAGKGSAQSHHAGVQMATKYWEHQLVKSYINLGFEGGGDHFNTTLTMGATLAQINYILPTAGAMSRDVVVCDWIMDPSYPFIVENMEIAGLIPQDDKTKILKVLDNGKVIMVRPEVTCAWFLGNRNEPTFRALFNGLDLHP